MIKRLEELEQKVIDLERMLNIFDEYSKHFMSQTLTIIGIVIAIAGVVIVGAMYFMIKSLINQKMDNEIERRILRILGEHPPVYFAKGESIPNENGEIILEQEIVGIEDLEPSSLLILDVKTEKITLGQLSESLKFHLVINGKGDRIISIKNYYYSEESNKGNGEVSWAIVWIRKIK